MTEVEIQDQLSILKKRLIHEENLNDDVLIEMLKSAEVIILNRRYPYSDYPVDEEGNYILENRYKDLQIRVALEIYAKDGAEGETMHTENGITRMYSNGGITKALLNEITPKGRVL